MEVFNFKKLWIAVIVFFMTLSSLISCGKKADITPQGNDTAAEPVVTHKVEIEVENYGTIALELYGEMAPDTVANFVKLTNDGFYNGLTFHRIISGFMIQGGDPEGTGFGGSDETIKGEFTANGFNNPLKHTRGVISMARSSASMDSASSQFFIMHQDAPHLDGSYAAFGKVTSGIEVVDAICENTPVVDGGTVLAQNQPKIKEIRVVE